jgi:hypothetical protein
MFFDEAMVRNMRALSPVSSKRAPQAATADRPVNEGIPTGRKLKTKEMMQDVKTKIKQGA